MIGAFAFSSRRVEGDPTQSTDIHHHIGQTLMTGANPKPPMATGTKIGIGIGIGCGCLTLLAIPIGILAAIALPSFLNQALKARQTEGRMYVSAAMRAEQAYFMENSKFAPSLNGLGLPPVSEQSTYRYTVKLAQGNTPNQSFVVIEAAPQARYRVKRYLGIVQASGTNAAVDTKSILCEAERVGLGSSLAPQVKLACPPGMQLVPSSPSGTIR
jgi:Tfp pilus assembly protein PilE